MIQTNFHYDVIVIGGGPSGASAATLLAKQGFRVVLFERDHFPRFHVGESLIPYCYPVIEKLGMLEKMKASHFTKKYGVQFISEQGKLSEPFRFEQYDPHERSQTWQVLRGEFDNMLLQNAREVGVEVHEGARVLDILCEGTRVVGVKVKCEGEEEKEVRAKVVVDASGQSSMIIDRFGLRVWDKDLKKAAVWTYWKGAIYFDEVARCPGVQPRLEGATRCEDFHIQKEYSYKATQGGGDGWVLVGDAYGFLDPLYSSGVLLALTSADVVSQSVTSALNANDTSEKMLRSWESEYNKAMGRMRNLVMAFYDGLNFGRLVRRYPDKKNLITDILIGNLFNDRVDELWPLIEELKRETEMVGAT